MNVTQGPYSQHFIFFSTYEYSQLASVLHYVRLERLASDKHSSLLDSLVSYKVNEYEHWGHIFHTLFSNFWLGPIS
jgi:hypothetical protein